MISILVICSVLLVLIVSVSMIEAGKEKIQVNNDEINKASVNKCGCGKTNDVYGHCDGSHINDN